MKAELGVFPAPHTGLKLDDAQMVIHPAKLSERNILTGIGDLDISGVADARPLRLRRLLQQPVALALPKTGEKI